MGVHLSDQSRADYSDYLKRFQEDPHSISTEEAVQRYREECRKAFERAFGLAMARKQADAALRRKLT